MRFKICRSLIEFFVVVVIIIRNGLLAIRHIGFLHEVTPFFGEILHFVRSNAPKNEKQKRFKPPVNPDA
jgi:hypothetical protein